MSEGTDSQANVVEALSGFGGVAFWEQKEQHSRSTLHMNGESSRVWVSWATRSTVAFTWQGISDLIYSYTI